MLAVEFLAPVLVVLCLLLCTVMQRESARLLLVMPVLFQAVALCFRPEDYNTDTQNYVGYLAVLKDAGWLESVLLTKFEPVHLFLAWISAGFRSWLFVEGIVWMCLAIGILKRARRLEPIAIILGCALPLYSSALRYSLGIMMLAYIGLRANESRTRWLSMSLAGGAAHVSLMVGGLLATRRIWWVLLAIAVMYLAASLDPDILERAGAAEGAESRASGLRSLLPLVAYIAYLWAACWRQRPGLVLGQLTVAASLFVATNLWFPILNRWIIAALVVLAVQSDRELSESDVSPLGEVAMATLLYSMLTFPFLFTLWNTAKVGDW
jgi:hypothetical protein